MFEFFTQHQFWIAVAVYWIFSAAVSSMPEPDANRNSGYLWLYRFLHTTAGNITTAFGGKIPGLKSMVLLLMIPVLLSTSACAAHYRAHPGALNKTDSVAYDVLLVAEAAINQAKIQYQSKTNEALDKLIRAYNITRESWLTYRGALAAQPQVTNAPPDVYYDQLNKNLTDLNNAIRALEEHK
jgi:hypothetical protein